MKILLFLFFCLCTNQLRAQEALIGMPQDILAKYMNEKDNEFLLKDIDGPINGYIILTYHKSSGDEKMFVFSKGICKSYAYDGGIEEMSAYIKKVELNYKRVSDDTWIENNNTFDLKINKVGNYAFHATYTRH